MLGYQRKHDFNGYRVYGTYELVGDCQHDWAFRLVLVLVQK